MMSSVSLLLECSNSNSNSMWDYLQVSDAPLGILNNHSNTNGLYKQNLSYSLDSFNHSQLNRAIDNKIMRLGLMCASQSLSEQQKVLLWSKYPNLSMYHEIPQQSHPQCFNHRPTLYVFLFYIFVFCVFVTICLV